MMKRRDFLRLLGAGGAAFAAHPAFSRVVPAEGVVSKPKLDKDLTLLISDCHINGHLDRYDQHARPSLSGIVAEVAALDPLPARILCLGDFSYLWGHKEDYALARTLLKPLTDLGMTFDVSLGNHDRRSAFLEIYPEYAVSTKIPGRVVGVVDAGAVDFIMLDGLSGADDRKMNDMGPSGGVLCADQQDWLRAYLPVLKKPVVVCSHWGADGLAVAGRPLGTLLAESPKVVGYIHGHDHRWRQKTVGGEGSSAALRTLCLPSTGHWGDIGYALMRTGGGTAVVTLRQKAFWFPSPRKGMKLWDLIAKGNDGQKCLFPVPRSSTKPL